MKSDRQAGQTDTRTEWHAAIQTDSGKTRVGNRDEIGKHKKTQKRKVRTKGRTIDLIKHGRVRASV